MHLINIFSNNLSNRYIRRTVLRETQVRIHQISFILPLSNAVKVYRIAAVASNITPTTAIPTDISIILVETYPVSENRFNAFLIKYAENPRSTMPGKP